MSPSVLGPSLTHMMTHGTETNVTSLLYNRIPIQNKSVITSYGDNDPTTQSWLEDDSLDLSRTDHNILHAPHPGGRGLYRVSSQKIIAQ
jgi:hypothetical protein